MILLMNKQFNIVSATLFLIVQCIIIVASPVATAAPVSVNWVYKISPVKGAPTPDMATKAIAAAGMVLGSVTVARGSDAGMIDKKGFRLKSHIKVSTLLSMLDSNLDMVRQSNGIFYNGVAFTQRYSDKRGSNPEMLLAATKQNRYAFYKGTEEVHSEPMKFLVVDIAMLPYAFIGRPAPKRIFSIVFSDGKSMYTTSLTPRSESLEVAGKRISAVRLSGFASGGALDLWIREADGYPLRMRVGLNARYGVVLDQTVQAAPATLFAL